MSVATTQFTMRIEENLKEAAQQKAKESFGMGLSALTKLFFKYLTGKSQVAFFVGDEEFDKHFDRLLKSPKVKAALADLSKTIERIDEK